MNTTVTSGRDELISKGVTQEIQDLVLEHFRTRTALPLEVEAIEKVHESLYTLQFGHLPKEHMGVFNLAYQEWFHCLRIQLHYTYSRVTSLSAVLRINCVCKDSGTRLSESPFTLEVTWPPKLLKKEELYSDEEA